MKHALQMHVARTRCRGPVTCVMPRVALPSNSVCPACLNVMRLGFRMTKPVSAASEIVSSCFQRKAGTCETCSLRPPTGQSTLRGCFSIRMDYFTRRAARALHAACVKLLCCPSASAGAGLINCFPGKGVSSTLRQFRLAKLTTEFRPRFSFQFQDIRRELRGDRFGTVAKP